MASSKSIENPLCTQRARFHGSAYCSDIFCQARFAETTPPFLRSCQIHFNTLWSSQPIAVASNFNASDLIKLTASTVYYRLLLQQRTAAGIVISAALLQTYFEKLSRTISVHASIIYWQSAHTLQIILAGVYKSGPFFIHMYSHVSRKSHRTSIYTSKQCVCLTFSNLPFLFMGEE